MTYLPGFWRASRAVAATGFHAKGVSIGSWPSERRLAIAAMTVLVLAATGLRLASILIEPSVNWGDEVFQTVEPAHRLVYGYGLVPWEFQLGMRSWLLPGFVTGLMEAARLFGDGPDYYLPIIAGSFAFLASAPVICCFLWARRWFGLAGALAAGAVVVAAPELVYFGARALSEVVAAHLLLIGIYLLEPRVRPEAHRRLFVAGLLLGLVCLLRVQLAPAAALVGLWPHWRAWRARFPWLLAGGLAAIALGAALDWVTLGYPLASVWRNLLYNILAGVSSSFGTEPWSYYLLGEIGLWNGGIVFLLIAAAIGARRLPLVAVAAAVILAVHSGIAHKEYRFIYPVLLLLTTLVAIGIAQLADWGAAWLRARLNAGRAAAALSAAFLLGCWGLTASSLWNSSAFGQLRHRASDELAAMSFASRLPALCGLGLYGRDGKDWVWYGGYTHLHRPVPMYWPKDADELAATAPAFDTLLYSAALPAEWGFTPVRCFGEVCVGRRPGSCEARPTPSMPFPDPIAGIAPAKAPLEAIPRGMPSR